MRLAIVICIALLINAMLVILMERMISRDRVRPVALQQTQAIEFVRTRQDDEERKKERKRKPPPKPQEAERPQARAHELLAQAMALPAPIESLDITNILASTGVAIGSRLIDGQAQAGELTLQESDLTPVSKIPPQYPPAAAMRNLEGVVKLLLHVRADGTVGNVTVLEADHGNVFKSSAVAAASRWRYRPLIREGVAVAVNVLVSLEYELE